jgi:hypothetical protein
MNVMNIIEIFHCRTNGGMFALNNNKDNSVENEHLIKCQYSNVVFYYYSNTNIDSLYNLA